MKSTKHTSTTLCMFFCWALTSCICTQHVKSIMPGKGNLFRKSDVETENNSSQSKSPQPKCQSWFNVLELKNCQYSSHTTLNTIQTHVHSMKTAPVQFKTCFSSFDSRLLLNKTNIIQPMHEIYEAPINKHMHAIMEPSF